MIHHLSISASNPLRVARVLAQILQGRVFEFSPHPGSYLVAPLDEYGTGIEVYPLGTQMVPGFDDGAQRFVTGTSRADFVATHIALSVPLSHAQIAAIGAQEGWRTVLCDRSAFKVLEFWLENRLMLELLTPELAKKYLAFATQPRRIEQFFTPVELTPA